MRKLFLLMATSILVFVAFILPLHPAQTLEIGKEALTVPKPVKATAMASYAVFTAKEQVPVTVRDWAVIWLDKYGWGDQYSCLDHLENGESGWNIHSLNVSSGAYGIGQALPASKMAPYGADYMDNPSTQLHWQMDYLRERYGSPCQAWNFWQAQSPHWY